MSYNLRQIRAAKAIFVVVVVAVAYVLGSAPALAQSSGDEVSRSAATKKKAQAHFDKGAEYYVQERYARAIVEFRKGYDSYPQPLFLYNIALAQAKLGQHDKALVTSRKVAGELPGKTAVSNQGLAAACGAIVEAEARTQAIADADAAKPTVEAKPGVEAKSANAHSASDDDSFGLLGWSGVAGLAAGSVALAGAGWTMLELDEDWAAYERAGEEGDTQRYEQLNEDISDKQTRGQILLYTGAGLTVAGATLLAVEFLATPDTQPRSSAITLTPSVGAEALSVELSIGF